MDCCDLVFCFCRYCVDVDTLLEMVNLLLDVICLVISPPISA